MSRINNQLRWCLKDKKRLIKIKPDINLANKHLEKSKYNFKVVQILEKQNILDWALNIGFYSIYHCFLAILSKHGYESRNQSCTTTVVLNLIKEKKLDLETSLVLEFDTIETEKNIINPTIRMNRELSTYGIETSIDLKQLERVKEMIIKVQKETIKILSK